MTLTVSGSRFSISFTDVAIGEVWASPCRYCCSEYSFAEQYIFPASPPDQWTTVPPAPCPEYLLKHDADREEALLLEDPDIRCYEVPKISFPGQEAHYRMSDAGVWRKENREESPYFTAVGFY